jgi:hypothetical protein
VFRAEGMKCVVKAEMKHKPETLTADGKLPEMLAVAEGANLSNQPANLALIVAQESISLQSGNYHAYSTYCNLGVALDLKDDVHGAMLLQAFQTADLNFNIPGWCLECL